MIIQYNDVTNLPFQKPFEIANLAAMLNKLANGSLNDSISILAFADEMITAKIIQSPFDASECVVITRKHGSETVPFSRPHIIYNKLLGQIPTPVQGHRHL